jgi:hypothetical protein
MPTEEYADLLRHQSGVISRAQALAAGLAPHDIKRLERRRDLVRLHPRVWVDHSGEPTWLQRAWGAVLLAWPAALCHESALRAEGGPGRRTDDRDTIHVAIDRTRSLAVPAGVRLHRLAGLDDKVRWNTSPPRVRIEHALVDVAAEARDDISAVSTLADAVQARWTTASRLLDAATSRTRLARREFLTGVLRDVDEGACSVLEHGYLTRIERAHRLPSARRQVRDSSRGPLYRDVVYEDFGQVVELDGRLGHASSRGRNADLQRDLEAAVDRLGTVRLGWGQVFDTACSTASHVGRLLQARGWQGSPVPCPACGDQGRRAG